MKKTVKDIDVKGKVCLVRVDFNVPLKDGKVADATRINAAMPTIDYLKDAGAKVVLMSHLGRPEGEPNEKYTLRPVAEYMGVKFLKSDVIVDEEVKKEVSSMNDGDVVLLENVRFRKEETKNEKEFAEELASLGDIFVNDAFGTAHRAHASTAGIADYLPCVSGFLIEKEVKFLGQAVEDVACGVYLCKE